MFQRSKTNSAGSRDPVRTLLEQRQAQVVTPFFFTLARWGAALHELRGCHQCVVLSTNLYHFISFPYTPL